MLRCTPSRALGQYNFGQPSLSRAFGPIVQQRKEKAPTALKATTLANGVRVVSHDLDGAQTTVGVYVDAGSKYDPIKVPGLSYVMRFAIQTSNYDSSLFQIDRAMRSVGNSYGHGEIRKRFLVWKTEGRRDMWKKPFEMLATNIVAPRFHESDIERFRDTMDNQLEEQRWTNPRDYVVDQLETVAFFKEPLGSPRMVPQCGNDKASAEVLLNHWASLFLPKNVTIAAVNVPHDELIAAYESLPYPHSASAPHFAKTTPLALNHTNEMAQFYPGREGIHYENRAKAMGTKPDMDEEVIAAVGSITNGAEEDAKKYAACLVAKEIFSHNLGESLSALNGDLLSGGVRAFYRPYSTAGLIGATVQGTPSEVESYMHRVFEAFPANVSAQTVATAVARAEATFAVNQLELNRDYCDFIATSSISAEEMLAAIKSVTPTDVESALAKAAVQRPAVYATGSTLNLPNIAKLKKHVKH